MDHITVSLGRKISLVFADNLQYRHSYTQREALTAEDCHYLWQQADCANKMKKLSDYFKESTSLLLKNLEDGSVTNTDKSTILNFLCQSGAVSVQFTTCQLSTPNNIQRTENRTTSTRNSQSDLTDSRSQNEHQQKPSNSDTNRADRIVPSDVNRKRHINDQTVRCENDTDRSMKSLPSREYENRQIASDSPHPVADGSVKRMSSREYENPQVETGSPHPVALHFVSKDSTNSVSDKETQHERNVREIKTENVNIWDQFEHSVGHHITTDVENSQISSSSENTQSEFLDPNRIVAHTSGTVSYAPSLNEDSAVDQEILRIYRAPKGKRKRVDISDAVKQNLCEFKKKNPRATYQNVVDYAKAQHNLSIGRTTVYEILKSHDRWLHLENPSPDVKRHKLPKYPELERSLQAWLNYINYKTHPISDELLIKKAREIGDQLGVTECGYSNGWLSNMKIRFGVKQRKPSKPKPRVTHEQS